MSIYQTSGKLNIKYFNMHQSLDHKKEYTLLDADELSMTLQISKIYSIYFLALKKYILHLK